MYIAVDFETDGPRMVSFVVRLVFTNDQGEHTMARYDTAHGTAHRDLLTPANRLREKRWMTNVDFFRALDYAVKDFKKNGSPHNVLCFGSSWGEVEFAKEEEDTRAEVFKAGDAAGVGDDARGL